MIKKQNLWQMAVVVVFIFALVPVSGVMAQDMDVTEANKEVVRGFLVEVFNTGDVSLMEEYLSPDFVELEETPMVAENDFEAMSEGLNMIHSTIPDFELVIVEIIAEDDKVAVLGAWTGTHEGDFMGMPATGNTFSVPTFDLFRVEDGLIVEHSGVTDNLAFMTQFGALEMPEME